MRRRAPRPRRVTSCSPMKTVPGAGSQSRARRSPSVDLPLPVGPTTATVSPAPTVKLTPRSAGGRPSFAYEGRPPALRGVSFTVGAGETVAVVGPTGSGKSTLGLLLARLWEPAPGTVFIGEHDVTRLGRGALRLMLGYVPQEGFLFSRSIAENITLGREDADAARVREAAGAAGIADETDGFLAGFDTVVGERGLTLSGGQRQRVALARALVGRPPILVLDDPFASVDASKEVELAQPYLMKVAIDNHILKADWLGLTWIVALYVGVLVLLYALHWLEAYLMNLTGQRVIHDLRAALFGHLLRLEAAFFDRNPVGRLMTRVLGDVEAVSEAFTSGLFAVVADVITLAGVVGVMLWLDWHLALVTFSIVPALVVTAGYFRLPARHAYRRVRQRLAHLNGLLQESLQGMAVIQLFARERHEAGRFREANRAFHRAVFASTSYDFFLYASVEALGSIAVAVLLWYGRGEIIAGAA